MLPALSLDGILTVKIVEGSFTTERFEEFIDGLLDHMTPFPGPNSVIVMDNCRIHRARSVREMIEERFVTMCLRSLHRTNKVFSGMMCEFLPSYSPDFNPIELAFSKFKTHIRRRQHILASISCEDDDGFECVSFLHDAVWSVTPEDAEGYFKHCNYN